MKKVDESKQQNPAGCDAEIVNSSQEQGATALEYALLAALIAVVIIAAVTFLGKEASQAFSKIGSALNGT